MDRCTLAVDLIDFQYALKSHGSVQTQQEKFGFNFGILGIYKDSQLVGKGQR